MEPEALAIVEAFKDGTMREDNPALHEAIEILIGDHSIPPYGELGVGD